MFDMFLLQRQNNVFGLINPSIFKTEIMFSVIQPQCVYAGGSVSVCVRVCLNAIVYFITLMCHHGRSGLVESAFLLRRNISTRSERRTEDKEVKGYLSEQLSVILRNTG